MKKPFVAAAAAILMTVAPALPAEAKGFSARPSVSRPVAVKPSTPTPVKPAPPSSIPSPSTRSRAPSVPWWVFWAAGEDRGGCDADENGVCRK